MSNMAGVHIDIEKLQWHQEVNVLGYHPSLDKWPYLKSNPPAFVIVIGKIMNLRFNYSSTQKVQEDFIHVYRVEDRSNHPSNMKFLEELNLTGISLTIAQPD